MELLTLVHFGEGGWTRWLEGQRGERETFNFIVHFQISYHANEFLYSKQIQKLKFCYDSTIPLQMSIDKKEEELKRHFHSLASVMIWNFFGYKSHLEQIRL